MLWPLIFVRANSRIMNNPEHGSFVTWRETLVRTTQELNDRVVAQWLCEHASGCEGAEFTEILEESVAQRSMTHLNSMLVRIAAGEPVQYAMGRWAFRYLDLMIDKRVLIPRPETEQIVDHVLKHIGDRRKGITILDLGTGSGAIGLSLLNELPLESCVVWMTDNSEDALDVARANGIGIGRHAVGARFAHGSWFEPLPEEMRNTFDVVVSNPPYISTNDVELEKSVYEWEPSEALFAGDDGLDAIRIIASQATDWLCPNGILVVEIGHQQGSAVSELFSASGFQNVRIHADLASHERFVQGIMPS